MKLDSIAQLLVLKGNVTDRNVDNAPRLFIYKSPVESRATSDLHVVLIPSLNGFSSNDETPNYHKGSLQLIVTASRYDEGYDLATALSTDLTLYGQELTDMYVYRCTPRHLPISYRANEQNAIEFSVNFDLVIRLK